MWRTDCCYHRGDLIRQAVAIVAEFKHGEDYLIVEIGGVLIPKPGMGHTGAVSNGSDREHYGQTPSHDKLSFCVGTWVALIAIDMSSR